MPLSIHTQDNGTQERAIAQTLAQKTTATQKEFIDPRNEGTHHSGGTRALAQGMNALFSECSDGAEPKYLARGKFQR